MTNRLTDSAPGATPLTPDDLECLKPTWITNRSDLDQAEADNIFDAVAWAQRRHWSAEDILSARALLSLHRRMFDDVWSWAGTWRRRMTNLGIHWPEIPTAVHALCLDVETQLAHLPSSPLSADDVAIRFHHRLVSLHPFANGNGRHARLATDILVRSVGEPPFTWGRTSLIRASSTRDAYLQALRMADRSADYEPLIAFARS